MRAVTARYPGAKLEPDNLEAFKADWAKMIDEFGVNRFNLGLQRAVMSTSFFPSLAEIRKHVPPPIESRWQPSREDLKRRAAGERSYGEGDILALWKMLIKRYQELGRPLTQAEEYELMNTLDRRKDELQAEGKQFPDGKAAAAGMKQVNEL
jgi:hypothetical protein